MDQEQVPHEPSSNTSSPSRHGSERTEPVRSRWTPKPEQIHILESIFNSGMVNPPRDETVRIRKLLEKFGTVSDANIFYWFQNRRSRTRRRQRQLKACLLAAGDHQGINSPIIPYAVASTGNASSSSTSPTSSTGYFGSSCLVGASSSGGGRGGDDDLFSMSPHLGLPEIDQNPTVATCVLPFRSFKVLKCVHQWGSNRGAKGSN